MSRKTNVPVPRFRSVICGLIGLVVVIALAAGQPAVAPAQHLAPTKHNLSVSGPGPIKALSETQICIFCHTPHRAGSQTPLWNRADPRVTYIVYDSPTLRSRPGQPTGSSRLCLSCHDGTIALGSLISEPAEIMFQGGTVFLPPGHSRLGNDLSDDHPVSFTYDDNLVAANPQLAAPSLLPESAPLDVNGQLQCTSCHDPHMDDYGDFLRTSPLYSQLCLGCHQPTGWSGSVHDISTATWNGGGLNPWPYARGNTVAENGCQGCHRPHESGGRSYLLAHTQEENNCLICHNGSVATDINSDLARPYTHPLSAITGVHVPGEDSASMPRHVECTDCHNPHAANTTSPAAPGLDGSLAAVTGIDIGGTPVAQASHSHEICFKCHGDTHGATSLVTRQTENMNTRLEFATGAISFHPIVTRGLNNDVPSLVPPLTTSSLIECTDCHSSSSGPAGPHGSQHRALLKLAYATGDNTTESITAYALCYSCHERASILGDRSFEEHHKHIVDERASCATCHDSHGIPSDTGTARGNAHLINFDLAVVSPDPRSGRLEFVDTGVNRGECYLSCHGENHSPLRYP